VLTKIYDRLTLGPKGPRLRTAEKIVRLCRKAWRVVHRLYQKGFNKDVPNPWPGVTMKTRVKLTKPAATREQVYMFAHGCIERGEVECGGSPVICFEWLQRLENVVAGHIKWTGCRTRSKPTIRIEHHKTGAVIDHSLESGVLVGRALHCITHYGCSPIFLSAASSLIPRAGSRFYRCVSGVL
jgi:hypothetical protein